MVIQGSGPSYSGTNRIMLFIDGGYLRRQFKNIMNTDKIDYSKLASNFTGWSTYRTVSPVLTRAYYYDATLRFEDIDRMNLTDKDHEEAVRWLNDDYPKQEEYFDVIRKTDFYDVRLGSLRVSNGKFQQKGVDTLIAIDMITKAYEQQYDEAVLLAGDRDFVKVVEAVKQVGPRVFGGYFEDHISIDLLHSFDRRKKLTVNEIKFWKTT